MFDLTIDIKPFDELGRQELYDLMVLRNRVFVVGQKITSEPEVDGRDPECQHVLMRIEDNLVGTARLFSNTEPVIVGRICVDQSQQRRGLGTMMMQAVQRHLGPRPAMMHAQRYLEDWYAALGWQRRGEVFLEAEIEHVEMIWEPDTSQSLSSQ